MREALAARLIEEYGDPKGASDAVWALARENERALLRSGKRCMSNITIAKTVEELSALPADPLEYRLADFEENGLFTGSYEGPGRGAIERDFEHRLAAL